MADDNEQKEQQRRTADQKLYIWKEKLKMVRELISNVGIPGILVLVFGGLMAATWLGYVKQPSLTGDAAPVLEQQHNEIVKVIEEFSDSHKEQTRYLKDIVIVLRNMRCDARPTDAQRAACFRHASNKESTEEWKAPK